MRQEMQGRSRKVPACGCSLCRETSSTGKAHVAASSPKPASWAHPDEALGQPVPRASTVEAGGGRQSRALEHWRSWAPLSWASPGPRARTHMGLISVSFGVSPPQRKGFSCLTRARRPQKGTNLPTPPQ